MACIYYIYIKGTTIGYIGQDTGNDLKRIRDHIKSAGSSEPDAVGRMINQYGLDKLRYLIFNDDNYGIPQDVYNDFLANWKYSGSGDAAKLDLAELLHVIRSKLLNTSAAKFNTLVGGFQASGVNATLTYDINTTKAGEDPTIMSILKNFRTSLEETRFSVNLQKFEDSWRKIVHPIGYLMLTGPFREALLKYVENDFLADLFTTPGMQKILVDYLSESLKNPSKKSFKPTEFNNRIKQEIKKQFESSTSIVSSKIKKALHDALGAHYIKDFKFSWNVNDAVTDKLMKGIFHRIDQMSNLMWNRVIQSVDGKAYVNHELIAKKGARENQSNISTEIFNLTNSVFTDFKWDKDVEPYWAQKLREVKIWTV